VKISPPRVPLVTILNDMNPSRTVVCLFSRTPGQETTHKFTGSGLDRIVVIGSDIPQLSLDDLRSAVAAKDDTWTIGGGRDGGAYLLGLPCSQLDQLRGLAWCTCRLHLQLLDRLQLLPVTVEHLVVRGDIDGPLDLAGAYRQLQKLCYRWLVCALAEAPAPALFGHVSHIISCLRIGPQLSRGPPLLALT
jgi:hypothetical protein